MVAQAQKKKYEHIISNRAMKILARGREGGATSDLCKQLCFIS